MLTRPEFADNLSEATVRQHFHPIEDLDWDVELDLERFYVPERFLSIHGTEAYETLTPQERSLLSLHEAVSNLSTAIWLENVLLYGFIDRLYDKDYASSDYRYMLHEVADEANHSIMFHQFIRKAGLGDAPVQPHARRLAQFFRRQVPRLNPHLFFLAVLAGEEPPDFYGRAALRDEEMHPLARRISEIHGLEESRHIAYAREYLSKQFGTAPAWQKAHARLFAPLTVYLVVSQFFRPRWPRGYASAPAALRFSPELKARIDAARRRPSPARRTAVRDSLRRLTVFFEGIGVIVPSTRWAWRRLGLLGA